MNEVNKVRKYIKDNNLLKENDSVIVGVSGGADSVCLYKMLLELRNEYKLKIKVIHINHGIRGDEALRDADFVKHMCEKDEVECEIVCFDVPEYSRINSLSEEEAGRKIRYGEFERQADKLGSETKIAVAHNLNDNGETVLHNICRGSGITGISGIRNVNGRIIRPLLCIERCEIENYLNENKYEFINDSTNFTEEYTRNKLRLKVIPYLEENINSATTRHLCELAGEMREIDDYLNKVTEEIYGRCVVKENEVLYIERQMLMDTDVYIVNRIIRKAIFSVAGKLKDITRQHIFNVRGLLDKQTGKYIELPYNICAYSEYNKIVLKRKIDDSTGFQSLEIDLKSMEGEKKYFFQNQEYIFEIIHVEKENINIKILENSLKNERNMYTKCFDYDKIKGTLQLRFRVKDDFFVCDGKGHTKKINRFFIDEKIPAELRDSIVLLTDGNHVLWIPGRRISEEYKITENTKTILKVTLQS